jgi:photosystem II stability/assembly factor-like uncharacterized protein
MAGNILDANELIKQGNTRSFYQPGGAGAATYFFGLDTQYHFIDGANLPVNGDINPIYVPDPRRANAYRLVSRTQDPPDLPEISLNFMEKWGGIPRVLMAPKCQFNIYEVHGDCEDLSDFYRAWASYMLIYSGFMIEGSIDLGTRSQQEGNDPLMDAVTAKGVAIYPVGALSFGEEAATNVVVEVIDAVHGTRETCGNCGMENDGSQLIYAITRANVGSPSAPGQLIYSTDGGATWTSASITGIGSTAEPRYIDIAGSVLFVGTDSTTLFYSTLNADTGAPGTWSTVTLPVAMRDVWVQSSRAIFFSADSGAVYKTTDITVAPTSIATGGVDNLLRIHGREQTIVAVGANGRVYYSQNGGSSWASATAPAVTSLNAIQVINDTHWWTGGANGNLYKTVNRGSTWSSVGFPQSGTGTIYDIVFATLEVAWIAHQVSSVAYLVTTLDGGASWARDNGTSRILNWPVFQKAGRIAVPTTTPAVAANYAVICGLATGGTDGLLLSAAPSLI